mmetsp:Transcript_22199/g.69644  ORF Transcript_22199/g.69644 Transcript_22199/m.69644 type:complete len:213 (-) Transcript_22199:622-1260(-)
MDSARGWHWCRQCLLHRVPFHSLVAPQEPVAAPGTCQQCLLKDCLLFQICSQSRCCVERDQCQQARALHDAAARDAAETTCLTAASDACGARAALCRSHCGAFIGSAIENRDICLGSGSTSHNSGRQEGICLRDRYHWLRDTSNTERVRPAFNLPFHSSFNHAGHRAESSRRQCRTYPRGVEAGCIAVGDRNDVIHLDGAALQAPRRAGPPC